MENTCPNKMSLLLENGEVRNPDAPLEGTACKAGDFNVMDGAFFAKFGRKSHEREDAEVLYSRVTSNPPIFVVRHGRVYPDSSPSFYSAQLLHYGLQPLKTNAAAKKRILAAFGGPDGKTLEVPKSILELEQAMRNWWDERMKALELERRAKSPERPIPYYHEPMDIDDMESSEKKREIRPTGTSADSKTIMERVHVTTISLLLKHGKPMSPDMPHEGTACKTGDFLFSNGIFFAKFGTQLHQRMIAADLYDLFICPTPLSFATDSGMVRHPLAPQSGPGEHGDYGAGFSCAQLLHYGLQPHQEMDLAKKKLLASFGGPDGKNLEVPKSVLEFEEAMRKYDQDSSDPWWRSDPDEKSDKSGSTSSMRDLEDQSQSSNRNMRDTSSIHDPSEAITRQTTLKRDRLTSFGRESPERHVSKGPGPPGYRTLEEANIARASKDSVGPKEWVKMYRKQESDRAMSGPEIRAAIKSLKASEARQMLTKLLDALPATERFLAKEISLTIKKTSGSKGHAIKPSQWEGLYTIEAPSLETCDSTFKVYSSSTSSRLWATFDLGVFSGVMRSLYPVPTSFDTEVYFEWRGRESGENIMTFHRDNRAVITFLPGGLLEGKMCAPHHGTFKIYGSIQVTGARGSVVARKREDERREEIRLWKSEWRGLNEDNYDLECDSRWGGSRGNPRDEGAFESDTTDGKQKRSWKIDLQRFMKDPNSDEEDKSDDGNSGDGGSEEGDSDEEHSEEGNSEEDDTEEEDDVDEY